MQLIFFPSVLLLFFGYVLSFDIKHIRVGIFDMDKSAYSRYFINKLFSTEYFDLKRYYSSPREINRDLATGETRLVFWIPSGFEKKLISGHPAEIQALIDGSDARLASGIQAYVRGFLATFQRNIFLRGRTNSPVSTRIRIWYNPELKSSLFLVTGLIVFILMVSSALSSCLSIVREKERGTIESLFLSPVRPLDIVLGKTLPYMLISFLSELLILIVSHAFFDVSIKGSILLFFFSSVLFIFAAVGQGVLISTLTDKQESAFLMVLLSTLLPALLLSGFIFPIRNMPIVIQYMTYGVSARYFVSVIRAIFLKGVGVEAFWKDLVALGCFSLFMMILASIRMRKAC